MGPDSVRETQSHLGTRNALLCQLTSDDGDAGESRVTGSPPLRLGADGARDEHSLIHMPLHRGPPSCQLLDGVGSLESSVLH